MKYIFRALTIAPVVFCLCAASAVLRPTPAAEMMERSRPATPVERERQKALRHLNEWGASNSTIERDWHEPPEGHHVPHNCNNPRSLDEFERCEKFGQSGRATEELEKQGVSEPTLRAIQKYFGVERSPEHPE